MSINPIDIKIGSGFVMSGTLKRAEMEEAAARVITACQLAGQWIAVSEAELLENAEKEVEERRAQCKLDDINEAMRRDFSRKTRRHSLLVTVTAGLWSKIFEAPKEPQYFVTSKRAPTLVAALGTYKLQQGLDELIENGFLIKSEGGYEVTTLLIETIFSKQNR